MEQTIYNFENLQDRVRYCAELVGNPSRLAVAAGLSRSQVWRVLERGSDVTTETAARLAKAAGVDPGWMLTGEGAPDVDKSTHKDQVVQVVQFASNQLCPIFFEVDFFTRYLSSSPDGCCAFQIEGNEHQILKKGSWCIVDESQKNTSVDGDYLIEFSSRAQIRYLEFLPTGCIRVQSNLKQQEYELKEKDISLINIVGKLVWSELRE